MSALRPAVLCLRGIRKSFPTLTGAVEVLRGVDLEMADGDFVMVTGPSGAGKTTLLNLVTLLDSPSAGAIFFDGVDACGLPEEDRCRLRRDAVGMVFQKFCLLPHRSALENVLFRFRYTAHEAGAARVKAEAALEQVGLGAIRNREARLLSAGEMQRVAIARAMVMRPRLLVADEPTGNLDRVSADRVMECLTALHRSGLAILMVTHNEALLPHATRHLQCRDGVLA